MHTTHLDRIFSNTRKNDSVFEEEIVWRTWLPGHQILGPNTVNVCESCARIRSAACGEICTIDKIMTRLQLLHLGKSKIDDKKIDRM